MEIKIKGYITLKKTSLEFSGKPGGVPLDAMFYSDIRGVMKVEENGEMTVSWGKKAGQTDFVFIISKNEESLCQTVAFNYPDRRTKFNSMLFEDRGNKKNGRIGGTFSTNECEEIQFSEFVETLEIDNRLTVHGGTLKIKGRVGVDPRFKYMITIETGVSTEYDA